MTKSFAHLSPHERKRVVAAACRASHSEFGIIVIMHRNGQMKWWTNSLRGEERLDRLADVVKLVGIYEPAIGRDPEMVAAWIADDLVAARES